MRKLLLGLGVVVLAALGSLAAWKLVDDSGREGALTLSTTPQLGPLTPAPSMKSPNGDYSIVVGNSGITLSGPNGLVELDSGGILVKSSSSTVSVSPGAIDVSAAATASVRGSIVRLGCSSGGQPVARSGSPVQVNGTASLGPDGGTAPVLSSGSVTQGSQTVFAC